MTKVRAELHCESQDRHPSRGYKLASTEANLRLAIDDAAADADGVGYGIPTITCGRNTGYIEGYVE